MAFKVLKDKLGLFSCCTYSTFTLLKSMVCTIIRIEFSKNMNTK